MLAVALLVAGGARAAAGQDAPGVEAAVRAFLAAFNDLDMPRFLDAFADDATAIHPPSGPPRTFPTRVQGRAEIERTFRVVFDEIRRGSGRTSPPFQDLRPQDLLVQEFGDVAVVTFHLGTPERRGRRTLVLHRTGSGWTIVHLHASVFEVAPR